VVKLRALHFLAIALGAAQITVEIPGDFGVWQRQYLDCGCNARGRRRNRRETLPRNDWLSM
jgi:hypothetical protein